MKVQDPLVCCLVLLFLPVTAFNKSDTYVQNATLPPIHKTTALPSIDPMVPNPEKRPDVELAVPPVSTSGPTQTSPREPVLTPSPSRKSRCNCITSMSSDHEELILRRDLFDGYDKRIRPILRKEDNVTVVLGISLNQLIDIDERNQVMILSLWLRQIWYNPFLRWNKSYYGGISEINIDPSEVWKPDLILYNNADDSTDGSLDRFKTQIKVNSEGRNMWLSPVILRSSCKITVKYFPFDEQHCQLKIGSWTYDGFHLDLIPETKSADTAKFVRNGEWDLIAAPCKRNVVKYVCCEAPYPDVTYNLRIRRRTLFFLFNLVIPCLVIVALTILSFYLPPDSGERISLVITNLLAMTVFMLLVAEIIPPTSDEVSIISIFYSCCIFEVGLALIGTCLVLKYHFSNPSVHEMPCWIRFLIIHCLGKFFMRKIPDGKAKESSKKPHSQSCVRTDNGYIETGIPKNVNLYRRYSLEKRLQDVSTENWPIDIKTCSVTEAPEMKPRGTVTSNEGLRERDHAERGSINSVLIQKQSTIADAMVKLVQAQEAQDREESQRAEWMMAASIMDNIFMWFFLISLVASFLALFFRIPSYEEQI